MKFYCENCRLKFESYEGTIVCPRCSSKKITRVFEGKKGEKAAQAGAQAGVGGAGALGAKRAFGPRAPAVLGEGKEAWMAAQTFEIKVCLDCGSTEFELNFKRREKTCKKCGSIFPLRKPGVT